METETEIGLSLGARLMKARISAGLEERETADKLKITPTYLRAIESDNYDVLPDTPFVVGYLKAYARLLDLDVDSILAEFHSEARPAHTDQDQETVSGGGAVGKFSSKTWVLVLIVSLVVWIVAVLLFGEDESAENALPIVKAQISSQAITEKTKIDNAGDEIELLNQLAADATTVIESSSVVVDDKEGIDLADATTAVIASTHETVLKNVVVSRDNLRIVFNDECWLEVTDSDGDVLAADIYQAGDVFETEGAAPFTVMLGNVRYADVFLNGEAYTLVPEGVRKTLRATVGE